MDRDKLAAYIESLYREIEAGHLSLQSAKRYLVQLGSMAFAHCVEHDKQEDWIVMSSWLSNVMVYITNHDRLTNEH